MLDKLAIPEDLRRKIHIVHGDKARVWLEQLPELVAKYQQLWDIQVISLVKDLSCNLVAHAIANTGELLIFKAVVPGSQFSSELQALEFFSGYGCVNLLKYSIDDGVMLMEEAQPGNTLVEYSHNGRDEQATVICAELIKKLHSKTFVANKFLVQPQYLHDLFKELVDLKTKLKNKNSSFDMAVLLRAEQEYADLLASTKSNVLLHADLHHFNILSSDRDGYLAIDPHGIVGDPCFEVAAFMRNPYPGVVKITNLKKMLQRRIDIFADQLGFSKERIWRWSLAQNVLSASWLLDDNSGDWQEVYYICKILLEIEADNR